MDCGEGVRERDGGRGIVCVCVCEREREREGREREASALLSLISPAWWSFKLFIPCCSRRLTHLHHTAARIRPGNRRSPRQPYRRSQISAPEMK